MATTPPPINKFISVVNNLTTGSVLVYSQSLDVSAIVLSNTVTNVSSSVNYLTVSLQKSGSATSFPLLYNYPIPPSQSLNPISGKLIVERYDSLIMSIANTGSFKIVLSVLENANS
jgi:hypothetical protein